MSGGNLIERLQEAMRAAGHVELARTLPTRWVAYTTATQAAVVRHWLGAEALGDRS